jgi:hypothetical protein
MVPWGAAALVRISRMTGFSKRWISVSASTGLPAAAGWPSRVTKSAADRFMAARTSSSAACFIVMILHAACARLCARKLRKGTGKNAQRGHAPAVAVRPRVRQGRGMKPLPSLVLALLTLAAPLRAATVLVEAEQFADLGGWDLDQQVMDQMGSPYLLAHGLGIPVRDAMTTVTFPAAGTYRVWARTRDWVAPWQAPGAPGKFQVILDDQPLATTFGTEGAAWHWQDGGTVSVGTTAKLALHDLTGFEGRCDALVFSSDPGFTPPNEPRRPRRVPPQRARPAGGAG